MTSNGKEGKGREGKGREGERVIPSFLPCMRAPFCSFVMCRRRSIHSRNAPSMRSNRF